MRKALSRWYIQLVLIAVAFVLFSPISYGEYRIRSIRESYIMDFSRNNYYKVIEQ
jgi:hypothetical protein